MIIIKYKALIFPSLVGAFVVLMTFFQISGSSIGVYDSFLGIEKDTTLIGEPRTVRSDEWVVTTPFIASQVQNNFPAYSPEIGQGQDMSLVVDVPYRDWSMLFKPQNWSFFVLPFDNALAFKWWFLAAALLLAVYFFVLSLYPKRYFMAGLLSVFFFLSPYIQWWYQSITILPIAYGLLILVLALKILQIKSLKNLVLFSIITAYLCVCFILLMYPAFQITIGLVIASLFLSILIGKKQLHLLNNKRSILEIVAILLTAVCITGLFLWQHIDAIRSTLDTVYPGSRNVTSGGYNPFSFLTWPLSYLLLTGTTAVNIGNNQSEGSNFILVGLIVLPAILYLMKRTKQSFTKQERVILVTLTLLLVLLAVRMFIPLGSEVFKFIGLASVPHVRLLIGIGVINLVILTIAVGRKQTNNSWTSVYSLKQIVTSLVFVGIYTLIISVAVRHFGLAVVGIKETLIVALAFGASTSFLLSGNLRIRYIGLSLLVIGSFASSALVNPLYNGSLLEKNPFVSYVASEEKKNSHYWVVNDSPQLSAMVLASGAEVYGGVNTYPQTSLWSKEFPEQEDIYNRYAHVRFRLDEAVSKPSLSLVQADSFYVDISPCDKLLDRLNIAYIVSETAINSSCLSNKSPLTFAQKDIYIYSRKE